MLFAALLLDAAFGEPRALWDRVQHPVVVIGSLINWLERRYNKGRNRRIRGALALWAIILVAALPTLLIASLPFGWVLEVTGGAILLAHRSLIDHVRAVAVSLDHSLEGGRGAVAMIVGRETATLDEAGVARAAIESAAENFSDGVTAPAFWFAVAGLPGIAIYKAVNTEDSMVGYRTKRYKAFGWAAARLDDALNWIPARLTGMLFLIVGRALRRFRAVWREAPLHKSVNAGWPEAGMAQVLDVALAGPRIYPGGVSVDDPFVNAKGKRDLGPDDIHRAISLLWRAWGAVVGLALMGAGVAWM